MFFQVTAVALLALLVLIELLGISRSMNVRRTGKLLYVIAVPVLCLFIYEVMVTLLPIIPKGG